MRTGWGEYLKKGLKGGRKRQGVKGCKVKVGAFGKVEGEVMF